MRSWSKKAWGSLLGVAVVVGLAGPGCSKENNVSQTNANCDDNADLCAPCKPGERVCRDNVLKTCQPDGLGFDAISVCATEALCVKGLPAGACAAPVCVPGDRRCDGSVMTLCSPGQDEIVRFTCQTENQCKQGLETGQCASDKECSVADDCAGSDTECRKRACTEGKCTLLDIPKGTALLQQKAGDCLRQVCDGQGSITPEIDPQDVPDDKNPCTRDECRGTCAKATCTAEEETSRNIPKNTPEPAGKPCQGGVCSGSGVCGVCVEGTTEPECGNSGGGSGPKVCKGGTWIHIPCTGLKPVCDRGACFGGATLDWNDPDNSGSAPLIGMDVAEVTQAEYKAWRATNPVPEGLPAGCFLNDYGEYTACQSQVDCGASSCDKLPQTCVSWCEAAGYCEAMGKRLCGKIGGGLNLTTPSTAGAPDSDFVSSEWYALCSNRGTNVYPYGDTYNPGYCHGKDDPPGTLLPPKSIPACSSGGIYDMSGNALEWDGSCAGIGKDDLCAMRGGSILSDSTTLTCNSAFFSERWKRYTDVGFRCCADDPTLPPPKVAIVENSDALCSDGIDNDGNGYTDCADFTCSKNSAVSVCKGESTNETCSDGKDNDENGFIDCEDFNCSKNPLVTVCNGENTNETCSDGKDNDGDKYIDCQDFDCSKNPKVTVCN